MEKNSNLMSFIYNTLQEIQENKIHSKRNVNIIITILGTWWHGDDQRNDIRPQSWQCMHMLHRLASLPNQTTICVGDSTFPFMSLCIAKITRKHFWQLLQMIKYVLGIFILYSLVCELLLFYVNFASCYRLQFCLFVLFCWWVGCSCCFSFFSNLFLHAALIAGGYHPYLSNLFWRL